MAKKFLTAIDLTKNELQNAQVQNLSGAPSNPVAGQLYFNTATTTLYWCEVGGGSPSWISARGGGTGFPGFGSVTQEQTFGATKNDGVSGTAARADHTHGNPVHDNAAHSAITLNSLAAPTAHISLGGFRINNLGDPSAATDAANKQYVDNLTLGLGWKDYCRAATTANITLSGTQTVDGVALVQGDRCLVKNQSTASANGIYDVYSTAWTRSPDLDVASEFPNAAVFISEGTTNKDTAWVCTNDAPVTVGTTNITWVQFAGGGAVTAGAGLTQSGNTLDVGAGTGITVAADTVSFDTTFGDGRYVNATGGDVFGGSANNWRFQDQQATLDMEAGLAQTNTSQLRFRPYNSAPLAVIYGDGGVPALRYQATTCTHQFEVDAATKWTIAASALTSTVPIVLPGNPSTALQAAPKQYVDTFTLQTRTISTTAPLTGGGDLSANRTLAVSTATTAAVGVVELADNTETTTGTDATRAVTPAGLAAALTTSGAKRFAQDVGGATSQVITHNLGTRDVEIQVYRATTPWDTVECDVERTSTTTATLRFTTAPASNEYRVVCLA